MIVRITFIAFLIVVLIQCKNASKTNDDFSVFLSHDFKKDTTEMDDVFNFGIKKRPIDSLYKFRVVSFSNSKDSISIFSKEKVILNIVLRNGDSPDTIIPKELLFHFLILKSETMK